MKTISVKLPEDLDIELNAVTAEGNYIAAAVFDITTVGRSHFYST